MNNTERQFVDVLSAGIRGNTAYKVYENVGTDICTGEK